MTDVAVNFLALMYPQGPWCLAAATPERDRLDVRTFTDRELAKEWIEIYNGTHNLYFHVNPPRNPHAAKKLKKTDVASLNYLHIDVDPSPGEASDAAFRSRALGLLTKQRPTAVPEPTAIVFSGGGFQAFWRLDTPLLLDGSEAAAESAKLYNIKLEQLLGGDHCHNIDRLMRLPGTWNVPSELKKKKGRELVEAALVTFEPSNSYDLSEFVKGTSAKASPTSTTPSTSGGDDDIGIGSHPQLASLDDLDKWSVPARVKTVLSQGQDADNPKKGDNSRSAWLFDAICQLIRFGVPDAIIYAICTDAGWKISESVLDKKSKADAYLRRQIEKAHGTAKTGEHAPTAAGAGGGSSGGSGGVGSSVGSAGNVPDFQRDKNNVPFPNQRNCITALANMGVVLSYDLFADRVNIKGLDGFGPVLQDEAVDRLYLEIDTRFGFRVAFDFFQKVISDVARKASFHPIRSYLDSLEWDGVPRIQTWLIEHAGAVDSAYVRAVSQLILVGAVRRVREPGCIFQEMLVLISSEQGTGKSTSLAALCPNRSWFTDDLPFSADSKTVIERLASKWIVEAGELKGLRNSDVEHLKNFLSRTTDSARLAYGRIVKEVPRQSIIIGTTNAQVFLRDTTGNRRFWPIHLTKAMSAAAILAVRDQLWAEASVVELNWQGDVRLQENLRKGAGSAEEEQNRVRLDDPYLDILTEAIGELQGTITSNDVWAILGVAPERRSAQSQAMGEAMRVLGFSRKMKACGQQHKESCYVRGESPIRIRVTRLQTGRVMVELENSKYPAEDRSF